MIQSGAIVDVEERLKSKSNYEFDYNQAANESEKFYRKIANGIQWARKWDRIWDDSGENRKWYVGGAVDVCYNLIERHVRAGRGNAVALIYASPMIPVTREITYDELEEKVAKMAGALAARGLTKGDRVLVYMPTIPETIIGLLAIVRLGAVHAVVFAGYEATEVTAKIDHLRPTMILTASCGIQPNKIVHYKQTLDEAIKNATHKPRCCFIYQRYLIESAIIDSDFYIDWEAAADAAEPHPSVTIDANDPLYILYTSGTTGEPKGVVRTAAGYLISLAYTIPNIFGLGPNDVIFTTSDFGWIVGHSYMCYAPLISGVTSVIYEGKPIGTPDPFSYFRIIQRHRVTVLFTIPTALRLLKSEPELFCRERFNLTSLRNVVVAGEHCDHVTRLWAENIFGVPVVNHWWQTELGFPAIATYCGLEDNGYQPKLSCGKPTPGFQLKLVNADGDEAKPHEIGTLLIKLPLPPGAIDTLYEAAARCHSIYLAQYAGYYDTKDMAYRDENGYVYVTMRTDDVINVSGHRLSTCAIEDVILRHEKVKEAAVVGIPDPIKGCTPLCFLVLMEDGATALIEQQIVDLVRRHIGPVTNFRKTVAVPDLPRTRSGKICRKLLVQLVTDGATVRIPPTIENPQSVDDIKEALHVHGYLH